MHRLVIDFEEGSLKKFATVDYQLDATEISRWDSCGGGGSIEVHAVHPDPADRGARARGGRAELNQEVESFGR